MARRAATVFSCTACGAQSPQWIGRCPECGAWSTLVEERAAERAGAERHGRVRRALRRRRRSGSPTSPPRRCRASRRASPTWTASSAAASCRARSFSWAASRASASRRSSSRSRRASRNGVGSVLYVSAEESAQQVKMRADRLGASAPGLFLLPETSLETILEAAKARDVSERSSWTRSRRSPRRTSPAAAGSVTQVRACAGRPFGAREDDGRPGLPHRPRHEGRDARGPEDARAPRRRGPLLRGRALPRAPRRAGAEEPFRPRARARDLRDDGRGPRRGREPVGALPRDAARARAPAPSCSAASRARGRSSSKSRPSPSRRSTAARAARRSASTARASRSFSRSSSGTAT